MASELTFVHPNSVPSAEVEAFLALARALPEALDVAGALDYGLGER